MKTLYIDCGMGAAGDMLTAALLELLPDPDGYIAKLNGLGIPNVTFQREDSVKCGICGTHVTVLVGDVEEGEEMHDHVHHHEHEHDHPHAHFHIHEHEHGHHEDDCGHEHTHFHTHDNEADEHEHNHAHHHHHSSMHDIEHIIADHLNLPEKVQKDVLAVYQLIAEAESHAHGVPVTDIHFHEVGTMDAIADITAVCMLMNEIAPDEVVVSPIHVGSGQVKCAHGILPVPAPATLYILQNVPIYGGEVKGELCTPTGAALLKHFATRFGAMPVMKPAGVGYGMGKKDFNCANCVRVTLGETEEEKSGDTILQLSCNVDDMTAEEIGFAMDRLFEAGARDVFTIPVGMKKNRPGTLICVICSETDKEEMIRCLFAHTSTIGIRITVHERCVLDRKIESILTDYGEIRKKTSRGYGVTRVKYEYDDLARIAVEQNLSIDEVKSILF